MRALLIFLYLMLVSSTAAAETQVNVVGLFNGKAILSINGGKPKTYSVGQVTPDGTSIKWNLERVYRARPDQPMRAAGAR